MRRRLLAASAALVLLVAGTLVLLAYVRGADARALAGARAVEVLVVDQVVPQGTPGSELAAFVRTEMLPARAAVEGRVTDLADLRERVATAELQVGEQLLASRFAALGSLRAPGTVEAPEGLQEVSVLLEPQRVTGGRVVGGDTVGVYLSQTLQDGTSQTSAVLHHVLVTQVQGAPPVSDSDAESGTDTAAAGTPAVSLMVTLAVTAGDAETVVYGMEHGTLWLSLETRDDEAGGTRVIDPGNVYVGVPR